MARIRRFAIKCSEPSCGDHGHFEASSAREEYGIRARGYKCLDHANPERVLSPERTMTRAILTATRLRFDGRYLPGLFWCGSNGKNGSGFAFGPGFYATANRFPEGTRLIVTAEIELPARAEAGKGE